MTAQRRQALLVAKSVTGMVKIAEFLRDSGCDCQIVTSYHDACQRVALDSYDLILSEATLPDSSGYRLISLELGSKTSLYFALPVYDSCLWLPAVVHGRHCFGEAALRPSEFTRTLREILEESRPSELNPPRYFRGVLGLASWSAPAAEQYSRCELAASIVGGGGRSDRYVSPKTGAHEKP